MVKWYGNQKKNSLKAGIMLLIDIVRKNKIGFFIGMVYSFAGVFVSFYGLGYGAQCPDIFPCDSATIKLINVLETITGPAFISWTFIGYFGGRLFGGSGAISTLIGVFASALIFGLIGAFAEKLIHNYKRASY